MLQTTLAIIKPDAVARGLAPGKFWPPWKPRAFAVALKMLRLSKAQAQGFYAVHKERPFFDSLTDYMSSGRWSARPCAARTRWPATGR